MRISLTVVALISATCLISGCSAPRGLNHQVSRPDVKALDSQQSPQMQEFAQRMSQASQNTKMKDPYLPEYELMLEHPYRNALGENCHRLWLISSDGQQKPAAVCQTAQGIWRFVPPLS